MPSFSSIMRQVFGIGLVVIGSGLLAFSFISLTQSMPIGLLMLVSGCALVFIGSNVRKSKLVATERPLFNRFITSVASAIVLIATAFIGVVLALLWFHRVR